MTDSQTFALFIAILAVAVTIYHYAGLPNFLLVCALVIVVALFAK